ncbi:MAG: anti-sigma factor [Anderseniella sp.]
MTDREDIDVLAAEYVLGTLDHAERSSVAARRLREPDLDSAINAWERRLTALNEQVADVRPSADVFDKILARIEAPAEADTNANSAEIIQLRSRLTGWRRLAIGATAIAAALAGIVIYNGAVFPSRNQQYVAVFNQGDQQPSFILSIDLETRALTIRPVAAQAPSGKSYELWIVSDEIKLRSLGLLDSAASPTRKQLGEFDPALLQRATFGISLEPEGGSPIGKPTGPALHGKLIPADN